jgi:glycosyltransferase involved in cell wall biosynthesis
MRVGLVIYGSLEVRSGGYLYDRKLVEYLRAAGDEVEIVSLPWRNYLQHLADNLSAARLRRLKDLAVDVLLQDELNHPSLFRVNRKLRGAVGYPIVSIVHHLRTSEQHGFIPMILYYLVERAYLETVDGFICNSRTTWGRVDAQTRQRAPFVVAYPGRDHVQLSFDAETAARRAAEPGPLRILFVGNVIRRKALHTLLEALKNLAPKSWQLTVIGGLDVERGYARRMQAVVQAHGWSDQVRFTGYVPGPDLPAYLAGGHVLAGPSQYEGFGIAYLEALGAGLPVIAGTSGAAGEFVREGENGYLVYPGDDARLAMVLESLHRDREALARMSLQARADYLVHPTWSETMAEAREFLVGLRK